MLTTIEIPVKQAPEKKGSKAKNDALTVKHEKEAEGTASLLSAILVFITLALILILSYTNGMLFFKELMVSSIIIIALMSFKTTDKKSV